MIGVDPEGLAWDVAMETVAMAEAMRRIPPRDVWIQDYRDEVQSEQLEAIARL